MSTLKPHDYHPSMFATSKSLVRAGGILPNASNQVTANDLSRIIDRQSSSRIQTFIEVANTCYKHLITLAKGGLSSCAYVVPVFIAGLPVFDPLSCTDFIMRHLESNGFQVTRPSPRTLNIQWMSDIEVTVQSHKVKNQFVKNQFVKNQFVKNQFDKNQSDNYQFDNNKFESDNNKFESINYQADNNKFEKILKGDRDVNKNDATKESHFTFPVCNRVDVVAKPTKNIPNEDLETLQESKPLKAKRIRKKFKDMSLLTPSANFTLDLDNLLAMT